MSEALLSSAFNDERLGTPDPANAFWLKRLPVKIRTSGIEAVMNEGISTADVPPITIGTRGKIRLTACTVFCIPNIQYVIELPINTISGSGIE
ncbi:MAG TPA: hypothetical protein VLX68_01680 [Chitinivibrionales bacterium]|nr:hypothetical protein [Chitinivibrionales bacterium]